MMLRKRRSMTEYGWIIGDRLVAAWSNDQEPPPGWTRDVPGSGCVARICDGTEGDVPEIIGYSFHAVSPEAIEQARRGKSRGV